MSELEEKLNSILSDPNMMQQIMGMARMMSGQTGQEETQPEAAPPPAQTLDPNMIQALSGIMGQGTVDRHQDSLLKALHPYLSQNRIGKLERAMRAAKLANAASVFLNAGGLRMLNPR